MQTWSLVALAAGLGALLVFVVDGLVYTRVVTRAVAGARDELRRQIDQQRLSSLTQESPMHSTSLYEYVKTLERRVDQTLTEYGADARALLDHFGLELVEAPPIPARRYVRSIQKGGMG